MLIEMTIKGLVVDSFSSTPIVILKDKAGDKVLSIWVGIYEANAIAQQIENVTMPRPMTHDLLRNLINDLGGKVDRIIWNPVGTKDYSTTVNSIPAGTGARLADFTLHPYAIRGCSVQVSDFDHDQPALTIGGLAQRMLVTNRSGAYSQTFATAVMSGNDDWANNDVASTGTQQPSGTRTQRDGMGIWTVQSRINEVAAQERDRIRAETWQPAP